MKHLIILSLLTLPLIACKSLNQIPPGPPADLGQKPDETPEDPVVILRKIVEWDSININTDDPEFVTYTCYFFKTYSSKTAAIAKIGLYPD